MNQEQKTIDLEEMSICFAMLYALPTLLPHRETYCWVERLSMICEKQYPDDPLFESGRIYLRKYREKHGSLR